MWFDIKYPDSRESGLGMLVKCWNCGYSFGEYGWRRKDDFGICMMRN